MAAATYPAEPDATKALDYQSVIALAQPDRVDGDPVSGHGKSVAPLRYEVYTACGHVRYQSGTPKSGVYWCSACVGYTYAGFFTLPPAPPVVTHTGENG